MKRELRGIVLGILITLMITTAFASGITKSISVQFNSVNLEVNGQKVDADTLLYEGTTYVPLRAAAVILDKEVGWNGETRTASINNKNKNEDLNITEGKYNQETEINRVVVNGILVNNQSGGQNPVKIMQDEVVMTLPFASTVFKLIDQEIEFFYNNRNDTGGLENKLTKDRFLFSLDNNICTYGDKEIVTNNGLIINNHSRVMIPIECIINEYNGVIELLSDGTLKIEVEPFKPISKLDDGTIISKSLEKIIKHKLYHETYNKALTRRDLLSIKSLGNVIESVVGYNNVSSDLRGIKYCTNLEMLSVKLESPNHIELDELKMLRKLKKLEINGNLGGYSRYGNNAYDIDFSFLEGFNSLDVLALSELKQKDFVDLEYATNLETLIMEDCEVENLNFLSGLNNLNKLIITGNSNLSNIEPIKMLIERGAFRGNDSQINLNRSIDKNNNEVIDVLNFIYNQGIDLKY